MKKVNLGTQDKKKVAILGALLAVAAVVFYINSSDSPAPAGTAPGPVPTVPLVAPRRPAESQTGGPALSRATAGQRTLQEFRPSLKPKKPEDRLPPDSIDPTLRLDILTKLQAVNVEGTHRSIFDFGQAPPPPPTAAAKPKTPVPSPLVTAQAEAAKPAQPPPPPPPTPIPLKFFGFITARNQTAGPKRAFFLEGDEIHVVTEGEVVKRRYKIVRIGVNSVVVEDLDQKNQQTLPLEAAPAG
jgi:hypothetical protein